MCNAVGSVRLLGKVRETEGYVYDYSENSKNFFHLSFCAVYEVCVSQPPTPYSNI